MILALQEARTRRAHQLAAVAELAHGWRPPRERVAPALHVEEAGALGGDPALDVRAGTEADVGKGTPAAAPFAGRGGWWWGSDG